MSAPPGPFIRLRNVRKVYRSRDQEFLARDVKIFESDGVKRAQHNPRLTSLAREIPRGNIYDRNGVLLATSDWNELERRREKAAMQCRSALS